MSAILCLAPEVEAALGEGRAVVALESTLICHGLPDERKEPFVAALDQAVRGAGAVPAMIAAMDGRLHVGLDAEALKRLVAASGALKCSIRELPLALVHGRIGATTVAATCFVAAHAGIAVMATGGIGGVHRGHDATLDVSADLPALARMPVAVVCSGPKILLDLPRTLEMLETLGVLVVGYGTDELPAFYARDSGLGVPQIDDVDGLAALVRAQRGLGLGAGLLVANPPPAEQALARERLEAWLAEALAHSRADGARGAAETPAVLRHLAAASGGCTVALNETLVLDNARLAAALACRLAEPRTPMRQGQTS